jgi:3'-5' exoribonuclease
MKMISEFVDQDILENAQFLVASSARVMASNGSPYLNLTLQDASGTIPAKKWELLPGDEEAFAAGSFVSVSGVVNEYKKSLQIRINNGYPLDSANIDFSRFVPSAPVPLETLEKKLNDYLDSLKDPDIKKLTVYLIDKFKDQYLSYPAAVRNHHAYQHGLLFHSLSMADAAEALCKLYPSLNRDLLVAGTLIHDIGKTMELSGPIATRFTLEGRLLGHISIMAGEVREAAKELKMEGEVPLLMEHLVLSHHGKNEFGSPITPETREALALSMIDDFDAKMNILDKALSTVKPGEWSQRIMTMDDAYFYNPILGSKK